MDYTSFKNTLIGLESWNPDQAILMKNLQLKSKPLKLNFCQRIILSITHSRAKNAVGAAENLQKLSIKYRKKLKKDEETLNRLINVNNKIHDRFALDYSARLSNKTRRTRIKTACKDIISCCENIKNSKDGKKPKLNIQKKDPIHEERKSAISFFKKMTKQAPTLSKAEANNVLIKAKKIREKLGKDDPGLRDAHFALRVAIRGAIFAERLEQNQNDLDALQANFIGESDSKIQKILEKWQKSLSKNKPIGIPKWFHCTDETGINSILKSGTIEVRYEGAWPGAFASTFPESTYGEYCIAMSSQIETNGQNETPLITNVVSTKNETIYVGKKPAPRSTKEAQEFRKNQGRIPVIWAGFRDNIVLDKPDKDKNPIGYYSNNNFVLLAQSNSITSHKDWLKSIKTKIRLEKLEKPNIDVLRKNEFNTLMALITQTFHCHVPHTWAEAEVKGHSFTKLSASPHVLVA